MSTPTVYADDPDAHWTFDVDSAAGDTLDWTPVLVAAKAGPYEIPATWLGDPAPSRQLRVPLDTLAVGVHTLYLKVPGGNDFALGTVNMRDRT
jgi:hypothetical protein